VATGRETGTGHQARFEMTDPMDYISSYLQRPRSRSSRRRSSCRQLTKLASGAVYWVTPPGGPRPKRVEVLADFLTEKLAPRSKRGTRLVY